MRHGVFLFMTLLVLLPCVIIGGVFVYNTHTMIINENQKTLASTVRIMDLHISRYYNHLVSDIQKKAEMSVIRNVLADVNAALPPDPDRQNEVRNLVLEPVGFPMVGGALIDSFGQVILSTRLEDTDLMLDKTELYKSIMEGEASYTGWVTDINYAESIEIAVPIHDEQKNIAGILRQDVDIEIMRKYLNQLGEEKIKFSFLIRKDGSLIFEWKGNSPALYHEYQRGSSLEKLVADFKTGRLEKQRGFVEFRDKGIEYIGAYDLVESVGCIAVIAVDKSSLYYDTKMKTLIMAAILFLLVYLGTIVYFTYRMHWKAFREINSALNRISNGDLMARCHYQGLHEFEKICENVNNLAESYQKSEKELRLTSRVDSLTRLPNWNTVYELLDTLLYKHPNQALILFELEGLKGTNDNLGYDIGDRILEEVGDILRKLPQHVCYPSRLGGTEFFVFVTNWTVPRYPERIADKIIKSIEGIRFIDDVHVDINVSAGIVYTKDEKADKGKMIWYCKAAMHKAKLSGKNSFDIHYPINHKE